MVVEGQLKPLRRFVYIQLLHTVYGACQQIFYPIRGAVLDLPTYTRACPLSNPCPDAKWYSCLGAKGWMW